MQPASYCHHHTPNLDPEVVNHIRTHRHPHNLYRMTLLPPTYSPHHTACPQPYSSSTLTFFTTHSIIIIIIIIIISIITVIIVIITAWLTWPPRCAWWRCRRTGSGPT